MVKREFILYVGSDQITNVKYGDLKYIPGQSPSYTIAFWALYEDQLLYVVTGYGLKYFEIVSDWLVDTPDGSRYFDTINPGIRELEKLLTLKPSYYVFDMSALTALPGNFCQFEMDLITEWNRDFKINSLLK